MSTAQLKEWQAELEVQKKEILEKLQWIESQRETYGGLLLRTVDELIRDTGRIRVTQLPGFVEHNRDGNWEGVLFRFRNQFGASVVRGQYTYGGEEGLWEITLLKWKGNKSETVCERQRFRTGSIGWNDEDAVQEILNWISKLPAEHFATNSMFDLDEEESEA
jgi:hypothetical protein